MIFSCARDCSFEVEDKKSSSSTNGDDNVRKDGERRQAKEVWAEELVLVQWDE